MYPDSPVYPISSPALIFCPILIGTFLLRWEYSMKVSSPWSMTM